MNDFATSPPPELMSTVLTAIADHVSEEFERSPVEAYPTVTIYRHESIWLCVWLLPGIEYGAEKRNHGIWVTGSSRTFDLSPTWRVEIWNHTPDWPIPKIELTLRSYDIAEQQILIDAVTAVFGLERITVDREAPL